MKKVFTATEIFQAAKDARDRMECYVSVDIQFYAFGTGSSEFTIRVYDEKTENSLEFKSACAAIECLNNMGKDSEPANEEIEFEEEVA